MKSHWDYEPNILLTADLDLVATGHILAPVPESLSKIIHFIEYAV